MAARRAMPVPGSPPTLRATPGVPPAAAAAAAAQGRRPPAAPPKRKEDEAASGSTVTELAQLPAALTWNFSQVFGDRVDNEEEIADGEPDRY